MKLPGWCGKRNNKRRGKDRVKRQLRRASFSSLLSWMALRDPVYICCVTICPTCCIARPWMVRTASNTLFAAKMSRASHLYNTITLLKAITKVHKLGERALFTVNAGFPQTLLCYTTTDLAQRTKMYLCALCAQLWWLPFRPKTNSAFLLNGGKKQWRHKVCHVSGSSTLCRIGEEKNEETVIRPWQMRLDRAEIAPQWLIFLLCLKHRYIL